MSTTLEQNTIEKNDEIENMDAATAEKLISKYID